MSDLVYMLGFGVFSVAFTLGILVYIRRIKDRMRRSVLRFERIRNKLED